MDCFWSQETSTVSGNIRRLRREYFDSVKVLSMITPVPIIGTNEVRDIVGMLYELQNLDEYERKGK